MGWQPSAYLGSKLGNLDHREPLRWLWWSFFLPLYRSKGLFGKNTRICSGDFCPRLAIKTKIIPWRTLIQMWPWPHELLAFVQWNLTLFEVTFEILQNIFEFCIAWKKHCRLLYSERNIILRDKGTLNQILNYSVPHCLWLVTLSFTKCCYQIELDSSLLDLAFFGSLINLIKKDLATLSNWQNRKLKMQNQNKFQKVKRQLLKKNDKIVVRPYQILFCKNW